MRRVLTVLCLLSLAIPARADRLALLLMARQRSIPVMSVTTDLQLWLDAADSATLYDATSGGNLVADGGTIARWQDKSGNARHATQGTAGVRPTRVVGARNGRAVVRMNTSNMSIASSTATFNFLHNGTASSVYFVIRAGASSNPDDLVRVFGNNGGASANIGSYVFYDDRSSVTRNNRFGANVARAASGAFAADVLTADDYWTPNVYNAWRVRIDADNATAGNRLLYRKDAGSEAGGNTLANAPSASNATYDFTIGMHSPSTTLGAVGDFCEILIYNRYLSTAEDTALMNYLNLKWGL